MSTTIETITRTQKQITTSKRVALAEFIMKREGQPGSTIALDDITETNNETFEYDGEEYLVLDDKEADEKTKEYILDSLWAFNAEFISGHTKEGLEDTAIKALSEMQSKLCESANPIVKAMIDDLDHFVNDAISCDGRGHFLSGYDNEENESGDYFIYRIQ